MKTVFFAAAILFSVLVNAQDNGYQQAMKQNLAQLSAAARPEDMMKVANQFGVIASAKADAWEPKYYQALTEIMLAGKSENKADKTKWLETAQGHIAEIKTPNAETFLLHAWAAQMVLENNPSLWQQQGQLIVELKSKAKATDPNNPRLAYLDALTTLKKPAAFGGGKEAACQFFKKASEAYSTYKSEGAFPPSWGKEEAEQYSQECAK